MPGTKASEELSAGKKLLELRSFRFRSSNFTLTTTDQIAKPTTTAVAAVRAADKTAVAIKTFSLGSGSEGDKVYLRSYDRPLV